MLRSIVPIASFLSSCLTAMEAFAATPIPWPKGLPVYDHIVIVVEENKDYAEIAGNPSAPYINGVLKKEGANFTRMFAEEHLSEGNYFWLFSGSNHTIGFADRIPPVPIAEPNLGTALIQSGRSFKGYSEGLPAIGSKVNGQGLYARKHVPWVSFSNLPDGATAQTSCNLRYVDFPAPGAYESLPTVAFVIPDLVNDMHNGSNAVSIPRGDAWLKANLDTYYQWAKQHNSLLILTFDECSDTEGYVGLTNPWFQPTDALRKDMQNRIVTIFAGAHIKPGDFPEGAGLTHVNILRTLEAMYGLPRSGGQQPNAAGGDREGNRISDDAIVTDVFVSSLGEVPAGP